MVSDKAARPLLLTGAEASRHPRLLARVRSNCTGDSK
jgi:hypothetical protein